MEVARLTLVKSVWDQYATLCSTVDSLGAAAVQDRMDDKNIDDEILSFCMTSGFVMTVPLQSHIISQTESQKAMGSVIPIDTNGQEQVPHLLFDNRLMKLVIQSNQ